MTATSSRNAYPLRNALRVVKQNKKMTIVTCILQLLGIPLAVGALMLELLIDSHRYQSAMLTFSHGFSAELYFALGCVFLGAAVIMGMFDAIHSFTETHKKSKVDMLYALPLTGKQRFFSNYLGGCIIYIAPYLVSVLIGWVLIFSIGSFVNFANLYAEFTTFGEFLAMYGKYYALGSMGLLALMLLYYTLSVLVTVCCGTLFESIYTNLLLNCLIPGTGALIIAIVCNELEFSFEYLWQLVGYTSPIGGLIYLIYLIAGESDAIAANAYSFYATQTHTHALLPSYFRWFIIILVLTAVLLIAAWQLYIRRKAEDVGKPFIYIAAYHVMLTLVTLAILCLMEVEAVGPALIFSAIVYFVMEVIRKRGFRKFWLSIVTYLATAAAAVGAFFLIVGTNGFGRTNYVPPAAGVSSVCLSFPGPADRSYNTYQYTLEYTDRQVISDVTAFHRDVISDRKNGVNDAIDTKLLDERYAVLDYITDDYNSGQIPYYDVYIPLTWEWNETSDDRRQIEMERKLLDPSVPLPDNASAAYVDPYDHLVELTYYTLTGNAVHREYRLNEDQMQQFYSIVFGTELYAEAASKGMYARLKNEYSTSNNRTGKSEIPSRLYLVLRASERWEYDPSAQYIMLENAPEAFQAISDAYREDLAEMTDEDFCTAGIYGVISDMPVYDCCQHTLAAIGKYDVYNGLREFNTCERFSLRDKETMQSAGYVNRTYRGFRIYAPGTFRAASEDYPHSTIGTMYVKEDGLVYEDAVIAVSHFRRLEEDYPELYALLGALRSNYITDEENCYMVNFDGHTFILPEADSALAEAVIAKGSNYYANAIVRGVENGEYQIYSGSTDNDLRNAYPYTSGGVVNSYDPYDSSGSLIIE